MRSRLVMIAYQHTIAFSSIKNHMILIKPFTYNSKTCLKIRSYHMKIFIIESLIKPLDPTCCTCLTCPTYSCALSDPLFALHLYMAYLSCVFSVPHIPYVSLCVLMCPYVSSSLIIELLISF